MKNILLLLFVSLSCQTVLSTPSLPGIFSDHAVIQAGKPVPVWGWSNPSEVVTVRLGQHSATITANEDGEWTVRLPSMLPSIEPISLRVSTVSGSIKRDDIVVGEVWIASGQSNMGLSLSSSEDGALAIAQAERPLLRIFKVPSRLTETVEEDVNTQWKKSHPEAVGDFSAVAFHFAAKLQAELQIPVGIIQTAHGGSAVEAWIKREDLEAHPGAQTVFEREPTNKQRTPTLAWNGMVAGLVPYPFRGLLWYQGETNTHWGEPPEYSQTFPLLISSWRKAWRGQDIHALFVQLPNFNASDELSWSKLREQQESGLSLPNTSMVVTIDQGNPNDIHPRHKKEVAERLYLKALAMVYGQQVVHAGPLYESHSLSADKAIVRFSNPEHSRLRLRPDQSGFQLAGEDRQFYSAKAHLKENTIHLKADEVKSPVAIRYAWQNNPPVALFNDVGLPAAPFRTDNWEAIGPRILTQPKSMTVRAGASTQLSLKATGKDLKYQWFLDGEALSGTTSPTLSFPAADAADEGLYRVLVSDGMHQVYSLEAALTVIPEDGEILIDPRNPLNGGWSATVDSGTLEEETTNGKRMTVFQASPDSWSSLAFSPPSGTADLSAREAIQFHVWNDGNEPVEFTAWALSGPGWGGSPSQTQITSGRIKLLPAESHNVVINLHQRYPAPDRMALCIDPSAVTEIKLVVQPNTRGRLAVGPVLATGTFTHSDKAESRIQLDTVNAEQPAPGKRTLRQLPDYAHTKLTHVLTLPAGFQPHSRYPILVDYPGNVFYYKFCYSTGLARYSNHGPAVAHGKDIIVLQLPFVRIGGMEEEINGFGDPDLTVDYALAAIEDVIERYSGDPDRIIFTGFSRGAYAADFIGLRNDAISDLWRGFMISQGHPKSSDGWRNSSEGFNERLKRLGERPVFLSRASWEGVTNITSADPGLGDGVHTDIGFLLSTPAAKALSSWIDQLILTEPSPATD